MAPRMPYKYRGRWHKGEAEAYLSSRRLAVILRHLSLHQLSSCKCCRDRRRGWGKWWDGWGWVVMAAGAGAGMTTAARGAAEVAAGWARTPVTPAHNPLCTQDGNVQLWSLFFSNLLSK